MGTEDARKLIVWGATGQCIVLAEFAARAGYLIVAVFDNNPRAASPVEGVDVIIGIRGFQEWCAVEDVRQVYGIAAIGGSSGRDRCEIHSLFKNAGVRVATLVHPQAYVARDSVVGEGCQILASATVCARAIIGRSCIINTGASVDHECSIAEGVHIGPGARLAGLVQVGERSFIGTGAIALPRVRIGSDSIVGAGSVVTRDIPSGVVAFGSPAKTVRQNRRS